MTKGGKSKKNQGHPTSYIANLISGNAAPKPSSGGRPSKRIQGKRNHHDSLKGGGGNNTGRRR